MLSENRDVSLAYFEEVERLLLGLEAGLWPAVELQWLFSEAWNNVYLLFTFLSDLFLLCFRVYTFTGFSILLQLKNG